MIAHLHMVIRLHCLGGLAWFHYDWKARRETCVMGPAEWGKCDPRQLLCAPGGGFMEDPFDPLPEGTSSGKEAGFSPMTPARPRQPPSQQRSGGSSARKQGGICRLFNRAPAGCSYGGQMYFLSIDAQSAANRPWQKGTVQKRLEALDHEVIQVTGGPPRNTFYHV